MKTSLLTVGQFSVLKKIIMKNGAGDNRNTPPPPPQKTCSENMTGEGYGQIKQVGEGVFSSSQSIIGISHNHTNRPLHVSFCWLILVLLWPAESYFIYGYNFLVTGTYF